MKYIDPITLINERLQKILSQPKGKIISKPEEHNRQVLEYGIALKLLIKADLKKKKEILKKHFPNYL